MADARWLTEADVVDVLDLKTATDVVEQALLAEARGAARTMDKTHACWGDGYTLHAVGGAMESGGVVGTKTWAHTKGGATPVLVLWDSETGQLRAIIEAFALGQLRTAAISALATRTLALEAADRLAIVGTGKQALAQVAAVRAVRPLAGVAVYSPTAEHRTRFAERVEAAFGVPADAAPSVAAAVAGATIVTTVTRATRPFLTAAMVEPGTHINAVGAITPERRELDDDLVRLAGRVVADSPEAARRLSSEVAAANEVVALSDVLTSGRPGGNGITVAKLMGIGLADVAVGLAAVERCGERGRPIPEPEKRRAPLGDNNA